MGGRPRGRGGSPAAIVRPSRIRRRAAQAALSPARLPKPVASDPRPGGTGRAARARRRGRAAARAIPGRGAGRAPEPEAAEAAAEPGHRGGGAAGDPVDHGAGSPRDRRLLPVGSLRPGGRPLHGARRGRGPVHRPTARVDGAAGRASERARGRASRLDRSGADRPGPTALRVLGRRSRGTRFVKHTRSPPPRTARERFWRRARSRWRYRECRVSRGAISRARTAS
jgi:hypothetical protein